MRVSFVVVLALAASLHAESGGGRLDWESNPATAESSARKQGRLLLTYFTVPGSPIDQALDAGALSDDGVVDASKWFICIRHVWNESPVQQKLRRTLRVTGAPTIVLAEPGGEYVDRLTTTDPREVEAQLRRIMSTLGRARMLRTLPANEDGPWEWIRQRIEDLGSDECEVRQRASDDLARLANSLREALRTAEKSLDPEVAARATDLRKGPSRAQGSSNEITVDVVIEWLQKGVKEYWIIRKIQDKGCTHSLADADLKRLTDAGAEVELLDAIQGNQGR